ncbi:LysR family transcriptional regulator ArgP [Marinobacterium lutimaris]|uniref:LysR family transcriptional regulator, chromosome initiation inhibitor n=1 Tax=Marinobacterium lutimaris TaxID=568106 RepID=A0A1H6CH48_9GAMM|nr:LysR family transcriptional regulator ArgP [Marinobacterium lutimaris]SEG72117.1 LysR family transcriptional regulator, chromosome initiation inhibitor [Marinobacterium lutimaris]
MLDSRQLAALAAVIDEGSFERAARKLHVTQSAVSQRVKQLEERLGQVLLVRAVPVRATEAGLQVLKHFRQLALLEQELLSSLAQRDERGYTQVSIGVNADSLGSWFTDAMERLVRRERLLMDLKVDDQDATQQLLKDGEVVGCITSASSAMPGCVSVPLGVMVYRCLATPAYIETYFAKGIGATGFRLAPVAEFSHKDQLQNRYLEQYFSVKPHEYPRHRVPSLSGFNDIVERGLACGMIPDQLGRAMIERGNVVDMVPGYFVPVPLYWHVWNLHSELIKQITDELVRTAAEALEPMELHPELS